MDPRNNIGEKIAVVEETTEIDLDVFEEGDVLRLTDVSEHRSSDDETIWMYTLEDPVGQRFTITNKELVKASEFSVI